MSRSRRAHRGLRILLLGSPSWSSQQRAAKLLGNLSTRRLAVHPAQVLSAEEPVLSAPGRLTFRDTRDTVNSARVLSFSANSEGPLGSVELAWRATHGPAMSVDQRTALARHAERARGTRPSATPSYQPRVPLWKRLAQLLQPSADLLLSDSGPLDWPAPLFEYQLDGVRALLARDALLLADDLGLGKTVQTIVALRILLLQHQVETSLIVVPASLVAQWRHMVHRWAPELRVSTVHGAANERAWQWRTPAHIYLTSYDTLSIDLSSHTSQSPPRRRTWDVVVLDEAQRIKNRETRTSRGCKELLRRRAWALTGTPLENSLDELASVMEFVTPHLGPGRGERLFPGPDLLARHAALQLRRRKQDVLPQLPSKMHSQLVVVLGPTQRAAYERAEREGVLALREREQPMRIEHVLALITRLKQLCNIDPASGQSVKLADLRHRLATLTAEGHRALVFTQFTDATFGARALATQLADFQPVLYTGDTRSDQRDALVQAFRADPARQVMILSLRAGGLGLNLQEASYVFHFDRWWNPAVERQAEDRSHRIGQMYPVHVYSYVCADTIEERIATLLRRKQVLFDEVVDGVSLDLRSILTTEEIFGLLG